MAIQFSVGVRNARVEAIEAIIGTSPLLEIRTGSQPADCATADSGTLLARLVLPSDWENSASGGQVTKNGVWTGQCTTPGTALYFRLKNSTGTTCHMQGSVGFLTGDLPMDDNTLDLDQIITVSVFTLIDANS